MIGFQHRHLQNGHALQVRLAARFGQLVRRLVDQRHVLRRYALDDALRAETRPAADVHHLPAQDDWSACRVHIRSSRTTLQKAYTQLKALEYAFVTL